MYSLIFVIETQLRIPFEAARAVVTRKRHERKLVLIVPYAE